jgi:peptide subunit release factor 1 (eRF1)
MITRVQIDQLLGFHNGQYLITSCYLNLDRARMPAQMLKIRMKDLLQSARRELQAKAGTHEQRESLRRDIERIETFVMEESTPGQCKAGAVFSCNGEKFWQMYRLPRVVRNILIADRDPYIRPLAAILAEYHRFGIIMVDRVHGQLFELYMGEMREHQVIVDPVPRRVSEGGLGGREERKIERHREHAVHRHFQHLADAMFALFKQHQFDWLILGGHREVLREFKTHLHPYLNERWVGDLHAEPGKITPAEVKQHAIEIEERVEWELERRLADELVRKAEVGNRAVSGVTATLGALTRGEAQMLLVEEGFETPGYVCYICHYVSLDQEVCPHCQKPTEPCPDIVDEAIELAMMKNCQIEHVQGTTPLRDAGRMGAMLRFQAV